MTTVSKPAATRVQRREADAVIVGQTDEEARLMPFSLQVSSEAGLGLLVVLDECRIAVDVLGSCPCG
jgi:hypothetical protein